MVLGFLWYKSNRQTACRNCGQRPSRVLHCTTNFKGVYLYYRDKLLAVIPSPLPLPPPPCVFFWEGWVKKPKLGVKGTWSLWGQSLERHGGSGENIMQHCIILFCLKKKAPKSWQPQKKLCKCEVKIPPLSFPYIADEVKATHSLKMQESEVDLLVSLLCSPMTKPLLIFMSVFQFHLAWQDLELLLIILKPK